MMAIDYFPQEGEVHDWRCDCEWCWMGVTTGKRPPKPPTVWQRLKAYLQENPDNA